MRTSIAYVATAAIALAVAGGASLAASAHAAAATPNWLWHKVRELVT
jgi:hypothetical protein